MPVVVSIPHAGTRVPPAIAESFANDAMRALPMTDWHVDKLYDFLPSLGITAIVANYSRFVVDLNRPPDATSLYPGRYETGLVATRTFQGDEIFQTNPDAADIEERRRQFHAPYHQRLGELLAERQRQFGRVILIDAHSVASGASLLHGELTDDIYLGNRDGKSCSDALLRDVSHAFLDAGFAVALNEPYKGGYITAHYGSQAGVEALQIEICQRLYMNESDPHGDLETPQYLNLRETLRGVMMRLAAL